MEAIKKAVKGVFGGDEDVQYVRETYGYEPTESEILAAEQLDEVPTTPIVSDTVVEVVEQEPIIEEVVKPSIQEEVQPVIHKQVEKVEIRRVVQPVVERSVRPLTKETTTLDSITRPTQDEGTEIIENELKPTEGRVTVTTEAARVERITKTPIIKETIITRIIEKVQPIITREIVQPHIITQIQPIYERIVLAPVITEVERPTIYKEVSAVTRIETEETIVQPISEEGSATVLQQENILTDDSDASSSSSSKKKRRADAEGNTIAKRVHRQHLYKSKAGKSPQ